MYGIKGKEDVYMAVKILLCGEDEKYILALEKNLIMKMNNNVEIHVITENQYFIEYFATPKDFDVVIIDEKQFDSNMRKHNFNIIFILTNDEDSNFDETNVVAVYKYLGAEKIVEQVMRKAKIDIVVDNKEQGVKVITSYSPVGGSGKTTITLALASALAQSGNRVLFLSMDELQSFGLFLQTSSKIPVGNERALQAKSNFAYSTIKPFIENAGFDFLPPFSSPIDFLEIGTEHYLHLIELIRKSGDYDVIVVDGQAGFSKGTTELMAEANNVIIVTMADKVSALKFSELLNVIDCSNLEKFTILCNRYKTSEQEKYANNGNMPSMEYIEEQADFRTLDISVIGRAPELQKLALKLS